MEDGGLDVAFETISVSHDKGTVGHLDLRLKQDQELRNQDMRQQFVGYNLWSARPDILESSVAASAGIPVF